MTQEELKEVLDYNPKTGIFVWKIDRTTQVKKGHIAGCVDSCGYAIIRYKNKGYKAHRLAWLYEYGEMPKDTIDHINHIKNDNRIENLRVIPVHMQGRNLPMHRTNTSGVTGVVWRKQKKHWRAQIKINGKHISIGHSKDFQEAVRMRKEAEKKYNFHKNHGLEECSA